MTNSAVARLAAAIALVALLEPNGRAAQSQQAPDIAAMFTAAEREGRVGRAVKTKLIDARPARPGEIVVTSILGEGKETQSPPASEGDMVVRNRCPQTGNEEYLVRSSNFPARYEGPITAADADGWRAYRPRGVEMLYFIVRPTDGSFTFTAPWGESMVARPDDAIVRNPANAGDTYRVAALSFACTYDVLKHPER